jgi:hypothetical protein
MTHPKASNDEASLRDAGANGRIILKWTYVRRGGLDVSGGLQ